MNKSLFGELEKHLTEEGIAEVKRMTEAYESDGAEGLLERILEIRDDINKEEIMGLLSREANRE